MMKTTDEKELVRNGYYYTRCGQQVTLDDWAMGQNGPVFIVCRFYEGEAMEGCLYPSGHTEITMAYEHEGEVEPVNELFKDSPIFVVEERYKQKSDEVLSLCQSIGKLECEIKNSDKQLQELVRKNKTITSVTVNAERVLAALQESIETAKDELNEKKSQISNAEDRLGDLNKSGDEATISKDELGELRKDQFKLRGLEAGGVDNWEWYDESLNDFRARYP